MRKAEKIARSVVIILLIIGIFVGRQSVMGIESLVIESLPAVVYSYLELISPRQSPLEGHMDAVDTLIGIDDIIFQLEEEQREAQTRPAITEEYIYNLRDFEYLRSQFFVSDRNTRLLPGDIDVDSALRMDLTIDQSEQGPQVLIFHTHSTEMFVDSDPSNPMDGVLGVGAHLAEVLEREYGIRTLHDTTRYDIVNGRSQIMGAYERMEPYIRQILRDNPSIEVVIDLHRDGLPAGAPPLVTYIDGQRVARIMFVNGLSRRYNSYGVLECVPWLPNPYLRENLAFSFQLQMAANRRYPGFTRRVYLKAFRYSLHMMPRSILLEVGAQNNTMEEAHNAVPHIAGVIAEVVLP